MEIKIILLIIVDGLPEKIIQKYKSTTSLITINNETHTGRDWAKLLGLGVSTINKYVRTYGLSNTIQFIEQYLANPNKKPKHNQSYYDLYMTIQN